MRTIKFRVWDGKQMILSNEIASFNTNDNGEICAITIFSKYGDDATFEDLVLMQFTGLLDKNMDNNCIYEGDIISLHGIIIGNKYENKNLLEDQTNLLIEGFGTKTWRITEKKAMARGCFYSE